MNEEDTRRREYSKRYYNVLVGLCKLVRSRVSCISLLAQEDLDRLAEITNQGSNLVPVFSEIPNLERYIKKTKPLADKFGYKY